MSTQIAVIKGKTEAQTSTIDNPEYDEAEISITRFAGGKERGLSIQLTLRASERYIQLDNKSARQFAAEILKALNEV